MALKDYQAHIAYNRRWRHLHPEKATQYRKNWIARYPERAEASRRKNHMRRFGITEVDYWIIHKTQGGVCAICGLPETRAYKGYITRLVVDHDHATLKVRGLLCHTCNTGLGSLKSIQNLEQAIDYLSRNDCRNYKVK